jgi:prevent-host-death family protein
MTSTYVEEHELIARLDEYLARIADGESFTITRNGRPCAVLEPALVNQRTPVRMRSRKQITRMIRKRP